MDDDSNHPELLSLTTKIVAAHAGSNKLATSDLPALIGSVFEALRTAGTVAVEKPVEALVPAVPIKKSVTPEFIVCLEDGKQLKMLKRHLATRYNMTPDEYRQALGAAQRLPDGGTGLCGAALGAGQEHRARPQAGRRGARAEPEPEPAAQKPARRVAVGRKLPKPAA